MSRRLGVFTPHSPEWYAAREGRIGGSEIAAVVNLSPYSSRYRLWQEKAGLLERNVSNNSVHWGTLLERVVRDEFLRGHPTIRLKPGTIRNAGTWVHDDHDWALYNPDGIALETVSIGRDLVIYEGKTCNQSMAWEWGPDGTDKIPPYYLTQVRWGMWVLGAVRTHLACLIGGQDLRCYVIEPDDADTEWMVTEAAAFIESLRLGIPPEIDDSASTYEAVRELSPEIHDSTVDLDDEITAAWWQASRDRRDAETRERRAKAQVLDAMAGAQTGRAHGQKAVTLQSKRAIAADGAVTYGAPYPTLSRGYDPTKPTVQEETNV